MHSSFSTLLLLGCLVLAIQGQLQLGHFRLCGSVLSNALSYICRGKYVSYHAVKRDLWTMEHITKRLNEDMERNKRKKHIVDECCHKSCTLSTLESYCAEPNSRLVYPFMQNNRPATPAVTARPAVIGRLNQDDFTKPWIFVTPPQRPRFRIIGK